MIINARYAGQCVCCGKQFNAGAKIEWSKSNGVRCVGRCEPVKAHAHVEDCPPEYDDCPPPEMADCPPEMETCPPEMDEVPF